MAHFEFVIPHNKEELLESDSAHYKVENIYSLDEIDQGIEDLTNDLQESGSDFILEHFDMLYSMLVHFKDADWSLVYLTYNGVVFRSLNELSSTIKDVIDTSMDLDTRMTHLNVLKMILYIYTQYTNAIQDRILLENNSAFPDKNRGKKNSKQKSKFDDVALTWDEKQRMGFISLSKIINFQLNKLWEPPVADEGFVNMCANCCYKALENPTISHVKSKPLRDTIFQLIGVLIKRYNHGINFVIKIVQLLSIYEHIVTPFAQAVVNFVEDLGCKSLFSNILQELMVATENSQDNNSIKSFSLFLVEIAGLQPEIMLPTTKELIKYLEKDQYSMRNCVLTVITTVLLSHFSQANMDEDNKEQRDIYLDLLEEHMLDNNAFVRSKVIQLWQRIVQQNALPKARMVPLLEMTTKRLQDKSSVVCKFAIQLLRIILESNQFAPEFGLGLEDLTLQLIGQVTRLEEMEKKLCPTKSLPREELWDIVEPELCAFLSITFVKTTEAEDGKTSAEGSPGSPKNTPTKDITKRKNKSKELKSRDETANKEESGDDQNLASKLNLISNLIKLGKFENALSMLQAVVQNNPEATELKVDVERQPEVTYFVTLMKKVFVLYGDVVNEESSSEPKQPQDGVSELDLEIQRKLVEYLTDALEFVKGIDRALEDITEILHTKPVSEILEAIELLTVAYRFGIPKARQLVPEMLDLVFSKETGVKEAVTAAYNTLYLTVNTVDRRTRAEEIVKKLISLVKTLDYGQHEALALLMVEWVKSGHIDDECIKVILANLHKHMASMSEDLILLEMIGRAKPKTIADNLPLLVKRGLLFTFNGSMKNNDLLQTAFFASRGIHNLTLLKLASGQCARYPSDHKMIQMLLSVIKQPFLMPRIDDINFINVAAQNINLLFELCVDPKKECERLLMDLRVLLKENMLKSSENISVFVSDVSEENNTKKENNKVLKTCLVSILTRYIFVVGHIAFKLMHYLEENYLETLKRKYREEVMEKVHARQDGKSKKSKHNEEDEDYLQYEMDALAAAEDAACEEVRIMLESQILSSNEIIGKCCSSVLNVCRNPTRYSNSLLKCVAANSLGKLMLVSSIYCKDNLQLLITMLEKSREESVRLAIVLTMGDLLFRFPNDVEPWTKHLYNRLKDDSHAVRMTTLLVIYFLVSNEMVKIKGQISLVALCIIDDQKEIADIARQFFTEIALKGNTLYNVMPDIISNLSNPESEEPLSEENFQVILKFLMSQIQKERQLESLVEKICKRMQTSDSERQWHDLTYCLSLLQWSDRSLRKLLDLANCYADKLTSPPVASLLQQIGSSVIKSTRPGVKEIGIEFNSMIEEILNRGVEALNDTNVSSRLSIKTPRTNRRTPSKTPGTLRKTTRVVRKMTTIRDSDEELSSSSDEAPSRRTSRKPKRKSNSDDEDQSSDSDSEGVPKKKTCRKAQLVKNARKKISSNEESSSSNSDNEVFKGSNKSRRKVERSLF